MQKLKGLEKIVTELRTERAHLVSNLRHVDAALAVLGKLEGGRFATESRGPLSESARRRISLAQRLRWAKIKTRSTIAPGGKTSTTKPKRTLSAAARRKIAAA